MKQTNPRKSSNVKIDESETAGDAIGVSWPATKLRQLRSRATSWFEKNNRPLPWRQTNDPYRIWISEIMLQQTQVATVLPYYHRFLERFPDVGTLAQAPIDDVLFHWAGLGYYRRARQLHEAAKSIVENHSGVFPTDFESIRHLKGIGRYTAGAIASFAFDTPSPIVEANTQRLYARLIHLTEPTSTASSQQQLWHFAESVLAPTGSGRINHALMEIGSQVCLPKQPRCSECPLKTLCPTYENNSQEHIPAPKPSKTYIDLVEAALIVRDAHGQILVRRCGMDERWAGLWDFPRFDVTEFDNEDVRREALATQFHSRFGLNIEIGKVVHSVRHAVTKYRIQLHCYSTNTKLPRTSSVQIAEPRPERPNTKTSKRPSTRTGEPAIEADTDWVSVEELKLLALNSSAKRLLKWIDANHSKIIATADS